MNSIFSAISVGSMEAERHKRQPPVVVDVVLHRTHDSSSSPSGRQLPSFLRVSATSARLRLRPVTPSRPPIRPANSARFWLPIGRWICGVVYGLFLPPRWNHLNDKRERECCVSFSFSCPSTHHLYTTLFPVDIEHNGNPFFYIFFFSFLLTHIFLKTTLLKNPAASTLDSILDEHLIHFHGRWPTPSRRCRLEYI